MESTKQAVKQTFGKKAEEIHEISEGLMHDTYRATVEGKDYIVQFSADGYDDHNSLRHCLDMCELLSDAVKVPQAVTKEVRKINGEKYIIVEKIEGRSGEKNISPEKTRRAGKELAKIHNYTTFEKEGWIQFNEELEIVDFEEGSLKEKYLKQLEEKLQTLREEGLKELADEVENFVEERKNLFPENFKSVICHDDFTPDNTIFLDGKVNGIIDMDYAFSGLDTRNIIKSANAYWMHDPGKNWPRQKFYQGYKEQRPLPENFDKLEEFFRIETLTQLVTGLIEINAATEKEIEFYRKQIRKELEK